MILRVEADGQPVFIDINVNGEATDYRLDDGISGTASVVEVTPGVFSVLFGPRSYTVHLAETGQGYEALSDSGRPRILSINDARDEIDNDMAGPKGPATIRAQMPGKVVRLLVEDGATVEVGQGLLVVEAMKMQNEVKAPKAGKVTRIQAKEGATVAAGEVLLVIE